MNFVHPVVPYDAGLVDDISARMDLRTPNAEALDAVAHEFDKASGQPFEAVCDLATAVGKTYLAGALIDYLASSGVRHFVIVTPGRTILSKTVNNFTAGHRKSVLDGMEATPVVITAENFNSGSVASAMADDNVVKLFVFSVQSLLRPDKTTRKTRKYQEWLGEDLYAYLKAQDDLVILADEHHVYSEKAAAFSTAVRDLDPMALVGLTATPAPSQIDKVIYHYPLARAIADKYVKTPVLVGRKDDRTDVDTRLRDGLVLLHAKQSVADDYATTTGAERVNAVMFVVADTIDSANAIVEVLSKPGLFGPHYSDAVLVVHSDAPDDALARLAEVESPDSPVRVIVSVSMLKEGWDVKNIFVICSFRPSISQVLTEQTLGRGLRLPWGAYTGVELLDTVEVLSHERYSQLLSKAGVLLEGLVPERAAPTPVPAPVEVDEVPVGPDEVEVSVTVPVPSTTASHGDDTTAVDVTRPTVLVSSLEARTEQAQAQAAAMAVEVAARDDVTVRIPKVTRTVTSRNFNLSQVPDDAFTELGRQLAGGAGTTLSRKVLGVIEDPSVAAGYRLVPTDATDTITAAIPELPYGNPGDALRRGILELDIVPTDRPSLNAARRFSDAVVAGAGGEDALAPYVNAATSACAHILRRAYRAAPPVVDTTISQAPFSPTRVNARPVEPNRFGKFDRKVAYPGWAKSLHTLNWFDSSPERDFANLADSDDAVEIWARIQRGEMSVEWDGGRYSPDFYVKDTGGRNYLIEVKSDRDADTDLVQAKKAAAEQWARFVTDDGEFGTWRYLLVPERVLATAKTFPSLVTQASAQ